MNLKPLFVIIPVYNRKKYTHECLISIRNQTYKDIKTIVIDDGSTDGTGEMIRDEFPDVILLQGDGNLWWTKAINIGVKYALEEGAEYILTLNDDTILSENYIEKMIYWAKRKEDALLGSLAFDFKTKKPVYGGEIINWKKAKFDPLLDKLSPNELTGLRRVSHFPGRGLLIPTQVFKKMGLFDEKHFPHYVADYDFTHRAERNGFEIYCNYDATLYVHFEESGDYQLRKNKSLKNYYQHLFGKKGGGNLKIFTKFAFINCPKKYLPAFLTIGLLKRMFGYLFDWFNEILRHPKLPN